ncbi:hypothetical protein TNCV_1577391 [Trichonephila clavipes]|nr:hypothetical protein TNCV_1577391 [Trichonephila clavipes]
MVGRRRIWRELHDAKNPSCRTRTVQGLSIHEAALVFLMKRQFRPKTRFRAAARRIIIEQRRMRKEASKMQGQVSIESQDSIHKSKPKSIK